MPVIRAASVIATLTGFVFGLLLIAPLGLDADASIYYNVDLAQPYGGTVGGPGAFLYSPAFAQALVPVHLLSLPTFVLLWRIAELAALTFLAGPWTLPILVFAWPITGEVVEANVHLLMALAIYAGLRWPALWAFPILTKPTVGVALFYFLGRGDIRRFTVALGVTGAIAAVSLVLAPGLWTSWLSVLSGSAAHPASGYSFDIPLVVRLPAAGVLAYVAGLWGLARLVPIAAMIALPQFWWIGLSMAVAALRKPLAVSPMVDQPARTGFRARLSLPVASRDRG